MIAVEDHGVKHLVRGGLQAGSGLARRGAGSDPDLAEELADKLSKGTV